MSGGKLFQSLTVLGENVVLVGLSRSSHLEEPLRVSMSRCSGLVGDKRWEGYSNVALDYSVEQVQSCVLSEPL